MARPQRKVPWLAKRDDGNYYANWYDEHAKRTRRLSLGTSSASEAQTAFAAFLTNQHSVTGAAPASKSTLTVNQVLDDYEREKYRDLADQRRADSILRHLRLYFGDQTVASLTLADSQAYRKARNRGEFAGADKRSGIENNRPVRDVTVRRELVMLLAAINRAIKAKRISADDAPEIELPPDAEPRKRWLTKEEFEHLRSVARSILNQRVQDGAGRRANGGQTSVQVALRVCHFIEIAYYTASRANAVERLHKTQIDLKQNEIALALPGERKTKKRRPTVDIHPHLLPTLIQAMNASTTEYVLGVDRRIYTAFKRTCVAAGFSDVSPHTLRHSRATHLLNDGESLWNVANLLGDTVETVEKTYGKRTVSTTRDMNRRDAERAPPRIKVAE